MIASWMMYSIGLSLVASMIAIAVEYILRLYGCAKRWVWVASLAGSLVLPLLAWLLAMSAASGIRQPLLASGGPPMTSELPLSMWSRLIPESFPVLAHANGLLVSAWCFTTLVVVQAIVLSYLRLHRERRSWTPAEVGGMQVLVSPATGPAVLGLYPTRIVIPSWVLHETERSRRLILAHEAEHVAAGDARLLVTALAAVIAMPWNPVIWWQLRRLRLAIELDCDARLMHRGESLQGYAEVLLNVGARLDSAAMLAAFAKPGSLLGRRLKALTALPPSRRAWRVMAALVVIGILGAAACIAPSPDAYSLTAPAGAALNLADRHVDSLSDRKAAVTKALLMADRVYHARNGGSDMLPEGGPSLRTDTIRSSATVIAAQALYRVGLESYRGGHLSAQSLPERPADVSAP